MATTEYERAVALRDKEHKELVARRDQAAAKARWWRAEIAAGRITLPADLDWLLQDLETAGMIAVRRPA